MPENEVKSLPKASLEAYQVYAALGDEGDSAFIALVEAFYTGVAGDPLLRPLYPEEDLTGAKERLALFLIQYFGGPALYAEQRGHPRLRMRHFPYAIGPAERDAWLKHMNAAIDTVPALAPYTPILHRYFTDAAVFLQNRP